MSARRGRTSALLLGAALHALLSARPDGAPRGVRLQRVASGGGTPPPAPAPPAAASRGLYACARAGAPAALAAPGSAAGGCDATVDALVGALDALARGARDECAAGAAAGATAVAWPPSIAPARAGGGGAPGCLELGRRHAVALRLANASGAPRCAGGAFVEARLEGDAVRARPRVVDLGGGALALELWLPDDALLAGEAVNLTATLLFRGLAGMALGAGWIYDRPDEDIPALRTEWVLARPGGCAGAGAGAGAAPPPPPPPPPPPLPSCRAVDFMAAPFWEGHWLRLRGVDAARAPAPCPAGACSGDAWSALHDGWVYRLPACAFHFFSPAEARACVNGSHLFGLGDSQWVDSQRNLLAHVLALNVTGWLRADDFTLWQKSNDVPGFRDAPPLADAPAPLPRAARAWPGGGVDYADEDVEPGGLRVSRVGRAHALAEGEPAAAGLRADAALVFGASGLWNAGPTDEDRYYGLASVYEPRWRARAEGLLGAFVEEGRAPDVFFVNSGMHDGKRFNGPFAHLDFAAVLADAAAFVADLRARAAARGGACAARAVWRSNVAPAGESRIMPSNPQRMEVYNRLVAAHLLAGEAPGARAPRAARAGCDGPFRANSTRWEFLDYYDMTWGFHFDNLRSDGGHYGRWHCGHGNFRRCDHVDLMMLHVLLNGLCDA